MYLSKLRITNFRCFGTPGTTFEFRQGINIIVGENNVGKSALADALRLLFSLGPGRRDLYVTTQDFHVPPSGEQVTEIQLDAEFADLTEDELGGFYELLVLTDPPSVRLHVKFERQTIGGQQRVRQTVWGGQLEGQPVGASTLDMITHIFLGALRDAEADLRPGRSSRFGQLVRHIVVEDADRARVLEHVKEANRRILSEPAVQRSAATLNQHLGDLAGPQLRQTVRVGFTPPLFDRVVESLRPLLPHAGQNSFVAVFDEAEWADLRTASASTAGVAEALDRVRVHSTTRVELNLSDLCEEELGLFPEGIKYKLYDHVQSFGVDQNGLGYNNLIYMGVVLGDLVERSRAEPQGYRALVIEEPEAHLHPQLQVLVYAFLDRTSRADGRSQVQVFVTSHSPTLASRAELDSIIVLYHDRCGKQQATAVRACPLDPKQKCDLQRYLDVTRSQLFFARGVLLVEGISEALLVPVLAARTGTPLDQSAIEVVPVSGVSFEPFARLFNSDDAARRIDIPCSIITDDDRCSEKGASDRVQEDDLPEDVARKLLNGTPSGRCNNVADLRGGRVAVFTARRTLEVELGLEADNVKAIVEAVKDIGHPKIASRIEADAAAAMDDWTRAAIVWRNVAEMKATLAQRLAWMVAEKKAEVYTRTFVAPGYVMEAIKHVTSWSPLGGA